MGPAALAAVPASPETQMSKGCGQVEAIDRQTAAIERLVDELKATREAFTPAADALRSLGDATKKLCNWIIGNRQKIAASIPVVLVSFGAISPHAAKLIGAVLQAWGVQ